MSDEPDDEIERFLRVHGPFEKSPSIGAWEKSAIGRFWHFSVAAEAPRCIVPRMS